MKKVLFLSIIAFAFFSCVQNHGPATTKEEKVLPVVAFVDSFRATHPNWSNNSATKANANEDFLELVKDTSFLYSLTEGIPMHLSLIRKDNDGKYIAHFYSLYAQDEVAEHDIEKVAFDIVATVSDSLVSILNDEKEYLCKWNIVGPVDYNTFCFIFGQKTMVFDGSPNIELDYCSKKVVISLGLFYADLVSIKPKRHWNKM